MGIDNSFEIDLAITNFCFQDWSNPRLLLAVVLLHIRQKRNILWRIGRINDHRVF